MTKHAYSPDTGELIRTETPAEWMGLTDVAPPKFDPATAGCFWRIDHWEIVQPPAAPLEVFVCTAWQIRKLLNSLGLRDAVEVAVAASTNRDLKDGWEFATAIRSDEPYVIAIGQAIGKTEAEVAALIKQAGTL